MVANTVTEARARGGRVGSSAPIIAAFHNFCMALKLLNYSMSKFHDGFD